MGAAGAYASYIVTWRGGADAGGKWDLRCDTSGGSWQMWCDRGRADGAVSMILSGGWY